MILFSIVAVMVMYTIMRTAEFNARELERVLQQRTVCTFEQLADALGTRSRMTVFRKLLELPYLTSYSHRAEALSEISPVVLGRSSPPSRSPEAAEEVLGWYVRVTGLWVTPVVPRVDREQQGQQLPLSQL